MRGRLWTGEEMQFLRANYPEQSLSWCAKQLGRNVSSVDTKIKAMKLPSRTPSKPRVKRERPDLGPEVPQLGNRCVGCGAVSSTRRCPECQKKHLARYAGECWGPTADEAYGVAL